MIALLFSFIIIILAGSCSNQSSGNTGLSSSKNPSKSERPAKVISKNEEIIQELRDSGFISRGAFLLTEESPIRYEEFLFCQSDRIPIRRVGKNSKFTIILYDIDPDHFSMVRYLKDKNGKITVMSIYQREKMQTDMIPVDTDYGKYYMVKPKTPLLEGELYGIRMGSCYKPLLQK